MELILSIISLILYHVYTTTLLMHIKDKLYFLYKFCHLASSTNYFIHFLQLAVLLSIQLKERGMLIYDHSSTPNKNFLWSVRRFTENAYSIRILHYVWNSRSLTSEEAGLPHSSPGQSFRQVFLIHTNSKLAHHLSKQPAYQGNKLPTTHMSFSLLIDKSTVARQ